MPYKNPDDKRRYQRRYMRKRRERPEPEPPLVPEPPADPVGALAEWAAAELVVPPGHPAAGQPMALPGFAVDFLRDSWAAHESALTMARKNAKSAICAVLALGFLVGPLRVLGWRGAVASVSKEKAAELRAQVVAIAEASRLKLEVRKSPYPGAILSPTGSLEVLSADRTAGHASGYDLVIVDETGLLPERSRDYLAGLRSSVSAKGGRVLHISVRGDSPLFREILNNPANICHIFDAPADCALDDRDAWAAANPALGTIKQTAYMEREVARVRGAPGDEPSFRAFDLNAPVSPSRTMICSPDDLRACFLDHPPERAGDAFLGFDFGEATSATAACAVWPATGRLETWMAFGDKPDLKKRARRDGSDYLQMQARGELRTYPGRVVTPARFLADVQDDLEGVRVRDAAADSYKDSEAKDFLELAGVRWPIQFRRVGAGKDGGRDVRAFQRLVLQERLRLKANLSLADAIRQSAIRYDGNGNPGLERGTSRGRIDVLSAAVIACGLAEAAFDRPARRRVRVALAK